LIQLPHAPHTRMTAIGTTQSAFHLVARAETRLPRLRHVMLLPIVAPHADGLSDCQTDDLRQRNILAGRQFLRLFEHRFGNLGFNGFHFVSRNFNSICAGVIASIPKLSTPAKFLKWCVTMSWTFADTASS
jgi:hypothetical protein